jgi:predicted transcriptional regulator
MRERGERRAERKAEIVDLLTASPHLTRRDIADSLGVSHQYVSALVEEMVVDGSLLREPRKARSTRVHHADMKAQPWPA